MEKHWNWFCYLWLQPAISSSSSGRHGKQVLPKLRPWILPREKNMVLIFGKVHLCENLGTVTTQTIDILAFWFANGLLQSWTGRRLQARSILETKTLSARTLLGTFGVCIIQLCMLHFFARLLWFCFPLLASWKNTLEVSKRERSMGNGSRWLALLWATSRPSPKFAWSDWSISHKNTLTCWGGLYENNG